MPLKFADDSEITGNIKNNDDFVHLEEINNFVKCCDDNYLYLNVSKTKEMCIDFGKCKLLTRLVRISTWG